MKHWHLTLVVAIFLTVFTNNTFWVGVISRLNDDSGFTFNWPDALFLLSFFAVLILITNTLLSFTSFKYLFKPILILLLLTSASAAYFMDEYTTMI